MENIENKLIEIKEKIVQKEKEFKESMKPLEDEYTTLCVAIRNKTAARIQKAEQGKGDFKEEELIFSAHTRCECGSGMAYSKLGTELMGSWVCSAILMGSADKEVLHTSSLPFAFYDLQSELQPSANGQTTRPSKQDKNDTRN